MNEFDIIKQYFLPLTKGAKESLSLLDDCAVIKTGNYQLILSTDTIVEGTHFFKNSSATDIANRLMGSSLSDIASKGAKPLYFMLNTTFSKKPSNEFLKEFSETILNWCNKYHISLIGGDSTMGGSSMVFSSTVFGSVDNNQNPVLRSNAKVGDDVYISGKIGGGIIGMRILEEEYKIKQHKYLENLTVLDKNILKKRYQEPIPRFDIVDFLLNNANSSVDLSDGLLADVAHIAYASKCKILIDIDKIPIIEPVLKIIDKYPEMLEEIIAGGDEYEVIFTVDSQLKMPNYFYKIGKVVEGSGTVEAFKGGKKVESIVNTGFKHF